jgi:hypothetical protein
MPVVINEIIIRASVATPSGNFNSPIDPVGTNANDGEDMVDKIMELLKEKHER